MVVNFEMCSSLIWIQKSLEERKLQSVCALKYKESMCQRLLREHLWKKVHVCVGEREKKCACVRERFILRMCGSVCVYA